MAVLPGLHGNVCLFTKPKLFLATDKYLCSLGLTVQGERPRTGRKGSWSYSLRIRVMLLNKDYDGKEKVKENEVLCKHCAQAPLSETK